MVGDRLGIKPPLRSEHEEGFANHGSLLWGLLSVEIWPCLFIDSQLRTAQAACAPVILAG
jgi:hypothetical protein